MGDIEETIFQRNVPGNILIYQEIHDQEIKQIFNFCVIIKENIVNGMIMITFLLNKNNLAINA